MCPKPIFCSKIAQKGKKFVQKPKAPQKLGKVNELLQLSAFIFFIYFLNNNCPPPPPHKTLKCYFYACFIDKVIAEVSFPLVV